MVRHWTTELRSPAGPAAARHCTGRGSSTALGAVVTALVLVIVLVTKFTHGAYIVVIAMPLLFAADEGDPAALRRGSPSSSAPGRAASPCPAASTPSCSSPGCTPRRCRPSRSRARPARRTLVGGDRPDHRRRRPRRCSASGPTATSRSTLVVARLPLPRHDRAGAGLRRAHPPAQAPRDVVAVFIPEYVVGHWWEHLLHNQSALRLKSRLLFRPGVMVTSVPWQLALGRRTACSRSATPLPRRLPAARAGIVTELTVVSKDEHAPAGTLPQGGHGLTARRRRLGPAARRTRSAALTGVLDAVRGDAGSGERAAAVPVRRGRRLRCRRVGRRGGCRGGLVPAGKLLLHLALPHVRRREPRQRHRAASCSSWSRSRSASWSTSRPDRRRLAARSEAEATLLGRVAAEPLTEASSRTSSPRSPPRSGSPPSRLSNTDDDGHRSCATGAAGRRVEALSSVDAGGGRLLLRRRAVSCSPRTAGC